MSVNQTHYPTKEQLLAILKSSYCLINNWGGSRFHYIANTELEEQTDIFTAFRNDTAETYKFSISGATIIHDGAYLRVSDVATATQYMFVVLSKLDLIKYM